MKTRLQIVASNLETMIKQWGNLYEPLLESTGKDLELEADYILSHKDKTNNTVDICRLQLRILYRKPDGWDTIHKLKYLTACLILYNELIILSDSHMTPQLMNSDEEQVELNHLKRGLQNLLANTGTISDIPTSMLRDHLKDLEYFKTVVMLRSAMLISNRGMSDNKVVSSWVNKSLDLVSEIVSDISEALESSVHAPVPKLNHSDRVEAELKSLSSVEFSDVDDSAWSGIRTLTRVIEKKTKSLSHEDYNYASVVILEIERRIKDKNKSQFGSIVQELAHVYNLCKSSEHTNNGDYNVGIEAELSRLSSVKPEEVDAFVWSDLRRLARTVETKIGVLPDDGQRWADRAIAEVEAVLHLNKYGEYARLLQLVSNVYKTCKKEQERIDSHATTSGEVDDNFNWRLDEEANRFVKELEGAEDKKVLLKEHIKRLVDLLG
jgi:hypothetical protein